MEVGTLVGWDFGYLSETDDGFHQGHFSGGVRSVVVPDIFKIEAKRFARVSFA